MEKKWEVDSEWLDLGKEKGVKYQRRWEDDKVTVMVS